MPAGGEVLFGYGSLVNPRSLARALGRDVAAGELRPAVLRGWRRTWGAAERVIPAGRDQAVWAWFLDLRADPAAETNGALIAVTPSERAALERRERGYRVVEVTAGGGPAFTFAGRLDPAAGTVVLREYLRLVEEGFAALGPGELESFRRTTEPVTAEILEGPYRFADAAQNALTTWAERDEA